MDSVLAEITKKKEQLKRTGQHVEDYRDIILRIDGEEGLAKIDEDHEYQQMLIDVQKLKTEIFHLEQPDLASRLVLDIDEELGDETDEAKRYALAMRPIELYLRRSARGGDFAPGAENTRFLEAFKNMRSCLFDMRRSFGLHAKGVEHLFELFSLEANDEGKVELQEFGAVMYDLHCKAAIAENREPMAIGDLKALATSLFEKFDMNKDGSLDLLEVTAGMSVLCAGTAEEILADVYRTFDLDGDCVMSDSELATYFGYVFSLCFLFSKQLFEICVDPEYVSTFKHPVQQCADGAAARIFTEIDETTRDGDGHRDDHLTYAQLIGWLSQNGMHYQLKAAVAPLAGDGQEDDSAPAEEPPAPASTKTAASPAAETSTPKTGRSKPARTPISRRPGSSRKRTTGKKRTGPKKCWKDISAEHHEDDQYQYFSSKAEETSGAAGSKLQYETARERALDIERAAEREGAKRGPHALSREFKVYERAMQTETQHLENLEDIKHHLVSKIMDTRRLLAALTEKSDKLKAEKAVLDAEYGSIKGVTLKQEAEQAELKEKLQKANDDVFHMKDQYKQLLIRGKRLEVEMAEELAAADAAFDKRKELLEMKKQEVLSKIDATGATNDLCKEAEVKHKDNTDRVHYWVHQLVEHKALKLHQSLMSVIHHHKTDSEHLHKVIAHLQRQQHEADQKEMELIATRNVLRADLQELEAAHQLHQMTAQEREEDQAAAEAAADGTASVKSVQERLLVDIQGQYAAEEKRRLKLADSLAALQADNQQGETDLKKELEDERNTLLRGAQALEHKLMQANVQLS